jgi:hypothetical protein
VPTHGETLKEETRVQHGSEQVLVDREGNEIFRGPMASVSRPVHTRHCEHCGPVELDGICGLIVGDTQCPECKTPW